MGVGDGASFNRIGGVTPAERNVIAQGGIGFGAQGGPGNLVIGNFIGTDISGSMTLAERGSGISLGGGDRPFIGGTTAGERNVISGNPYSGIKVGATADYTFIGGNYIGTDASGQVALGNVWSSGIEISQGTHIFVQGNLIAHHRHGAGITVSGYNGNTLRQNLIYDNEGGGIVLQNGGNNGASPPVITSFSATGVSGTACPGCEVEIFIDIEDEGQVYEGSTIANASGAFAFSKGSPLTGPNITATATDSNGNTSEFSAPMIIPFSLSTSVNPLGAGTVTPSGTNWYNSGQSVSISATANSGYSFSDWSGCDNPSGNICNLTMNINKNLTANFTSCPNLPVRRASWSYNALQDAYNGAVDGDTIQSQAVIFSENLDFNRNISITIMGGSDCNYLTNIQKSVVNGTVTIRGGTVTMENIIIR
jgi:parallel beta-helix repeat protein